MAGFFARKRCRLNGIQVQLFSEVRQTQQRPQVHVGGDISVSDGDQLGQFDNHARLKQLFRQRFQELLLSLHPPQITSGIDPSAQF